jgi:hypothetical protein
LMSMLPAVALLASGPNVLGLPTGQGLIIK